MKFRLLQSAKLLSLIIIIQPLISFSMHAMDQSSIVNRSNKQQSYVNSLKQNLSSAYYATKQ